MSNQYFLFFVKIIIFVVYNWNYYLFYIRVFFFNWVRLYFQYNFILMNAGFFY